MNEEIEDRIIDEIVAGEDLIDDEAFIEQAMESLMELGLTEDEAERELDDYLTADYL